MRINLKENMKNENMVLPWNDCIPKQGFDYKPVYKLWYLYVEILGVPAN